MLQFKATSLGGAHLDLLALDGLPFNCSSSDYCECRHNGSYQEGMRQSIVVCKKNTRQDRFLDGGLQIGCTN